MKTFLILITIIIAGFGFMIMGFLLREYVEINQVLKNESWEKTQEVREMEQLVGGLNNEIRQLKEENTYLEEVNQELEESYGQSWTSNTEFDWEVIRLKSLNRQCIDGLELCLQELAGQLE